MHTDGHGCENVVHGFRSVSIRVASVAKARSKLDWILEAAALAALLAMFAIIAVHWNEIPARPRPRFLPTRGIRPWNPQTVLWIMMALSSSTYLLLTVAGLHQKWGAVSIEVHQLVQSMIT